MKRIVLTSFLGALGLFLLLIGSVTSGSYWTLLIFYFHFLLPVPLLFVNRQSDYDSLDPESTLPRDLALFCCTGIIIFTIAFPVFLARLPLGNPSITIGNCVLCEISTILLYTTTAIFFKTEMISEDEF